MFVCLRLKNPDFESAVRLSRNNVVFDLTVVFHIATDVYELNPFVIGFDDDWLARLNRQYALLNLHFF